ncbi:MAG: phosphatidate cytidylyltransferase [Actinobacteria bacterium]|nr:phosphatidate cytidylyltransferase [Actinomycetota bacterium]
MKEPGGDFEEPAPSVAPDPAPPGGRSLAQAAATGTLLLGVVILVGLAGSLAFFGLICAVAIMATFELLDALTQTGHRPNVPFGAVCALAMPVLTYLDRPGLLAVVVAVAMFGSFLLALRPDRGATPASDIAWTILGVIWIGGGGAGAVSILTLGPSGALLLTAFVFITALGDTGAYFSGTIFGKHKLAPSISPGKTWEGLAGGIVSSLLAGVACGAALGPLSLVHGLGMGAVVALLAPTGDLVESLVKREIGIKDSGRLLPGHGGFLDRLDAMIFCAPFVFLFLRFVARI